MALKRSDEISECLAYAEDARERGHAATDPRHKAYFMRIEMRWQRLVERYRFLEQATQFLEDSHLARIAAAENLELTNSQCPHCGVEHSWWTKIGSRPEIAPPTMDGNSLAELLDVLVRTAIQNTEGEARAAFYIADDKETKLHHIVGMPDSYARRVDGFPIGSQSLACGLAAAIRVPVITPDVTEEPRWKPWLSLAKEFDYRACWSFPVETSAKKVVGTFAMYYRQPREPTRRELDLASALSRTAADIISHH